ncbi:hypothetical protein ACJX0J_030720, partial [Zea mays]
DSVKILLLRANTFMIGFTDIKDNVDADINMGNSSLCLTKKLDEGEIEAFDEVLTGSEEEAHLASEEARKVEEAGTFDEFIIVNAAIDEVREIIVRTQPLEI